jgi:hypothetical protein
VSRHPTPPNRVGQVWANNIVEGGPIGVVLSTCRPFGVTNNVTHHVLVLVDCLVFNAGEVAVWGESGTYLWESNDIKLTRIA